MADLFGMLQAAAGASAGGDYQISRSLRFNSADSAYLSRTPASAGNRKTWTWSGWVKKNNTADVKMLFGVRPAVGTYTLLFFDGTTDRLSFLDSAGGDLKPSALFRDVSAWYHVVIAVDTTQATSTNRVKFYVNGNQLTAFDNTTYPSQNLDTFINSTDEHQIGAQPIFGNFFNGYMTDVHFIDGQALTPSSFGEVDSVTGVWKPIRYAGTYGTNGFHLDFSDNSSTTALGYDAAGSNNWTPNNFSVTAGAGNDSLVDTPTQYGTDTGAGGEVRGNYCTLNPLYGEASTISNGNLNATYAAARTSYGTFSFTTGKWYWELTVATAISGGYVGIMDSTYIKTDAFWGSEARAYQENGDKYGGSSSAYGASWTDGDVIGFAIDMDAGTIVFYKNGVSQGTAFSDLAGKEWKPMVYAASVTYNMNFGQRPFAHTAPSGFKALCTTNLPDPTVVQGDDYFNTVLYTGNGSSGNAITGVGFQPDFVWIKGRSGVDNHNLHNAIVGAATWLQSDSTTAEQTNSAVLTSFDSDGFTVGSNPSNNSNGATFVGWNWKANGAGVSNTDGSIPSTVSANTTAGISIVAYTGTDSTTENIGHGLGQAPEMIIVKSRDSAEFWPVYHKYTNTDGGENYLMRLNTTDARVDSNVYWNDTAPTSTVFTVGTSSALNNTDDFIAYCFAPVEGFSKFGSYTGNGSADGPFVYTGFRPAWVMIKQSSASGEHWTILDNQRNLFNVENEELYANLSNAEGSNAGNATLDFLSNGFKIRTNNAGQNTSSATYIYACFASNPFKTSLAR